MRDEQGKFTAGNPGGGRPRGRISKLREALADKTRDGAELVETLTAIYRDPTADNKDRIKAIEIALSYLVGKPETVVSLEADIRSETPLIDARSLLTLVGGEAVTRVVEALDGGELPLLDVGETALLGDGDQ